MVSGPASHSLFTYFKQSSHPFVGHPCLIVGFLSNSFELQRSYYLGIFEFEETHPGDDARHHLNFEFEAAQLLNRPFQSYFICQEDCLLQMPVAKDFIIVMNYPYFLRCIEIHA